MPDFEYLNRELRIRYQNIADRLGREDMLELYRTTSDKLQAAAERVNCWVCMDKGYLWSERRGWFATWDGNGTHNLYRCGRCNPGAEGDHRHDRCCNWELIRGAMYCAKDDYATNDEYAVRRLVVLAERGR